MVTLVPFGWIEADHSDEWFNESAIGVFRRQVETIPAYAAYVRYLGVDPSRVADWREIPAVPTSAFKSHDLSAAPVAATAGIADGVPGAPLAESVVFETSGTSISRPGRVRLSSTRLYEISLLESFRHHVVPDAARPRAVVFGPARADAPHSSLWFMVDRIVRDCASGTTYVVRDGIPDWEAADTALLRAASSRVPVMLLGTTLLFMAYFERLRLLGRSFTLPPGSRVMDTGGAKGLRAEFERADVEAAFLSALGIPATHVVNEYGMAELGSQFYDDNFRAAHEGRAPIPGKRIPPWVRTRVLDPESLEERREGASGLLVHYDLANLEIPLAIQTEDVGKRYGQRLILERRLLGAEARGCSLAFERFLDEERPRSRPPEAPGATA